MDVTRRHLPSSDSVRRVPVPTSSRAPSHDEYRSFLFYLGLPNSPIVVTNDDDDDDDDGRPSSSSFEQQCRSSVDNTDQRGASPVYDTFFSGLVRTSVTRIVVRHLSLTRSSLDLPRSMRPASNNCHRNCFSRRARTTFRSWVSRRRPADAMFVAFAFSCA
jgi:hypothetical protein